MTLQDDLERWKVQQQAAEGTLSPNPSIAAADWLGMFMRSGWESAGELFGISPSADVERWQAQNPWAALGSELLGVGIPYAGYYKGATGLRRFDHLIDLIGDAEKAPFLTGVAQEAARFLPFEAARVAGAATFGDQPTSDVAFSALTDLALAGGIGGLAGSIAQAGQRRVPIPDLVPGADLNAPIVLQMRQLADAIAAGAIPAERMDLATRRLAQFSEAARTEEMKGTYLGPLMTNGTAGDMRQLNRLFRLPEQQHGNQQHLRRSFTQSGRGFASRQDWLAEARAAGLPDKFEMWGQFFRHHTFTSPRLASQIDSAIQRNMTPVGNNWFWTKEANDGLYVMARKFQGTPGTGAAGDKWVVFKTDRPQAFIPTQAAWSNQIVRRSALWYNDPAPNGPIGVEVFDKTAELSRNLPMRNWLSLAGPGGNVGRMTERLMKATGADKLAEKGSGAAQLMDDFVRQYFTPTIHQFTKSPRATWIWGVARSTRDLADTIARKKLFGERASGKGNIYSRLLARGERAPGNALEDFREGLDDKDLWDAWRAQNRLWSDGAVRQAFANNEISEKVRDLLTWLRDYDLREAVELRKVQNAAGRRVQAPDPEHLQLARSWAGDYRSEIINEGGETVFVASGRGPKTAQAEADAIVAEAAKAGKNWKATPVWQSNRGAEVFAGPANLTNRVRYKSPDYAFAADVRETRLAGKAAWSKGDFFDSVRDYVLQQHRYMADITNEHILAGPLQRLRDEDPLTYDILRQRMNDLVGKPGPLGALTNKVADKLLSPFLGRNSASKIASITNSAIFHLNLGALNPTFPLINALGVLQTTIPEAVLTMTAVPAHLAPYYTAFAVAGANGLPAGGMNAINPFKLMWRAFKLMGKPTAELSKSIDRKLADGTLDPRFVEEFVGQGATTLRNWREILNGPEGMARYIGAISSALPSVSEKFTRTYSYVMGWVVAKDFFRMADEQAEIFAKEFTHRTMFGYGTEDRARVFTTPVGSMLGLFKNWMMHYMGMMLEYTGQGLREGNWKPLLWQTAGTTGLAGISGTAIYGIVDPIAQWMGQESLMQTTYDLMGETETADGLFLGLPAMMGVSLASGAQQPFANPARDASQLFSFVLADRMMALGEAMGGAYDHFLATGENPVRDPNTRDQIIRALAPKTLYRVMAGWEDKTIRSMATGYPALQDLSGVERVLYQAGFNPTRVELAYRVNDELWRETQKMRERVQAFGEAWAHAQESRDSRQMWQIMQRATAQGVDVSSVIRSGMARMAKGREDMLERQFSPEQLMRYRAVLDR